MSSVFEIKEWLDVGLDLRINLFLSVKRCQTVCITHTIDILVLPNSKIVGVSILFWISAYHARQ